jgi:hypothetical protein
MIVCYHLNAIQTKKSWSTLPIKVLLQRCEFVDLENQTVTMSLMPRYCSISDHLVTITAFLTKIHYSI